MAHTITFVERSSVIEVKISGDYYLEEAKQVVKETIEFVENHNCYNVLTDAREAKIHLSVFDLYNASQEIKEKFTPTNLPINKLRRALVVDGETPDLNFLENVNFNKGHAMQVFYDIDEARKWLNNN